MLLIRTIQVRALEEALQGPDYEAEMLRYLQAHHAATVAGRADAVVLRQVRELTQRARAYGAPDALAWGEFIELAMSLGERFDREPWAAAILRDIGPGAPAWNDKVAALIDAVPEPFARVT